MELRQARQDGRVASAEQELLIHDANLCLRQKLEWCFAPEVCRPRARDRRKVHTGPRVSLNLTNCRWLLPHRRCDAIL
jgi:hypothetical protein